MEETSIRYTGNTLDEAEARERRWVGGGGGGGGVLRQVLFVAQPCSRFIRLSMVTYHVLYARDASTIYFSERLYCDSSAP